MKSKQTTWTTLILELLRQTDDFMNRRQIKARVLGINDNQLSAALLHLRKRHAVDVIIQPDGEGWWYPLPEQDDDRTYTVEERTLESKPRKRRAKAK